MQKQKLFAASLFIALPVLGACASGGDDAESVAGVVPSTNPDAGNGAKLPPSGKPATEVADAAVEDAATSKPDAAGPSVCTSTMALIAGGAAGTFATSWSSGTWAAPQSLAGSIASTPAIAPDGSGYLAVSRANGDALVYTHTTAAKAPWSPPLPVSGATSQGAPALVALSGGTHLVYWGMNSKFYHGIFAGGAWDAASDPVGGVNSQSFGPSAPVAAATLGGTAFMTVQSGADSNVYLQGWNTSWGSAAPLSGGMYPKLTTSPRVATLSDGSSLVVFSHSDDLLLFAVRRPGSPWDPAMALHNDFGSTVASSPSTVALAALPSGGAVLVYMGADGQPYSSLYPPNPPSGPLLSTSPWSAPVPLPGSPAIATRPELATGVCGADATLAYATTTGSVELMSLHGSTWSAPSALAGISSATYAAIATKL